jgi:hypothetical protein
MSTFFEKLSKTAKKTATTIGTKSAEMVSAGKLKLEIKQLEGKIKDKKLEIGAAVYQAYAASTEPDLQVIGEMCGEIAAFESQIKELEQQLRAEGDAAAVSPSPDARICPGCGSAEKEGTSFCSQCGHKLEKSCKNCGESLKPGIKFCSSCGTPVE